MTDYTHPIARHYATYRPLLHTPILERLLPKEVSFQTGLDIGCGTGQSAIALAGFCDQVFGVEPSRDMLQMAIPHPQVEYHHYNGKKLPFPDGSFEVVSFAGSLFYAKSQTMADEVVRVSRYPATLLIYDFEVLFDDLGSQITQHFEASDYDHTIDFSGLKMEGLNKVSAIRDQISFSVTSFELAHLLLSVKAVYHNFAATFKVTDPYARLVDVLKTLAIDNRFELPVAIFASRYNLV
ncbi:MAG: hypothetical protein DHS20C18_28430 [Saprospiraceae bacterium]|nr:MAG: hypothetical protein DHS20C18_28430 [Saprospiraceae bacterium]